MPLASPGQCNPLANVFNMASCTQIWPMHGHIMSSLSNGVSRAYRKVPAHFSHDQHQFGFKLCALSREIVLSKWHPSMYGMHIWSA